MEYLGTFDYVNIIRYNAELSKIAGLDFKCYYRFLENEARRVYEAEEQSQFELSYLNQQALYGRFVRSGEAFIPNTVFKFFSEVIIFNSLDAVGGNNLEYRLNCSLTDWAKFIETKSLDIIGIMNACSHMIEQCESLSYMKWLCALLNFFLDDMMMRRRMYLQRYSASLASMGLPNDVDPMVLNDFMPASSLVKLDYGRKNVLCKEAKVILNATSLIDSTISYRAVCFKHGHLIEAVLKHMESPDYANYVNEVLDE